jgi:predicted nucleotidyltransferase
MRITEQQIRTIHQLVTQIAGDNVEVRLFGSRLDDRLQGGDVDLMVDLPQPVENPALLAARLSASISRSMQGRKVDVLVGAPNLKILPIHEIAHSEGVVI